jgi:hypothetical protein
LRLGSPPWAAGFVWDYFDHTTVPHLAIQYWLKTYGESVYEYRSKTGRWPVGLDDLGETTLPVRFPLWRETANNVVMVWPKELKTDSKENGGVLLAYYNGGLLSKMGRRWVCWGDLRTEYLPEQELKARLNEQGRQVGDLPHK